MCPFYTSRASPLRTPLSSTLIKVISADGIPARYKSTGDFDHYSSQGNAAQCLQFSNQHLWLKSHMKVEIFLQTKTLAAMNEIWAVTDQACHPSWSRPNRVAWCNWLHFGFHLFLGWKLWCTRSDESKSLTCCLCKHFCRLQRLFFLSLVVSIVQSRQLQLLRVVIFDFDTFGDKWSLLQCTAVSVDHCTMKQCQQICEVYLSLYSTGSNCCPC